MSHAFPGCPQAASRDVQQIAGRLTSHLQQRFSQEPAFRADRFPTLARIVASAAPDLALPDLATAAEMTAWIYAVDDLIDGRRIPAGELRRRLQAYARRRGSDDPLGRALGEIDGRLSCHQAYRSLAGHWNEALERMLEAMHFEAEQGALFASGETAPPLDLHMTQGAYSSGLPVTALTFWILQDRPETPAWIEDLWPFLLETGRALRLNNDLVSAAKKEEEQVLNLVLCRAREAQRDRPGLQRATALHQAQEWARNGVLESLRRARGLLERLPEPEHPAPQTIWRLTQFCLHTPLETDYPASSVGAGSRSPA